MLGLIKRCLFLFVGVIFTHFERLASTLARLLLLGSIEDRSQIGLPLGPIAINELRHVLGLLIRVLQVDIRGLRGALIRVPILGDPPWFSRWLSARGSHDSQGQADALALTTLEEPIVLHIHFQHVLHLEDLAHPRRTQVLELAFLRSIIILVSVQFGLLSAQVFIHDRLRSAVDKRLCFIAVILLHRRDLELVLLLLLGACGTSTFFDGLDYRVKRVEVTRLGLPTAQLAAQLELVRLDRLAALAVVDVQPNVNIFSRIVLILVKAYLNDGLGRTKELDESSRSSQLQLVVLKRDLLGSLEDVQTSTTSE